jgi:hypothetical protein
MTIWKDKNTGEKTGKLGIPTRTDTLLKKNM